MLRYNDNLKCFDLVLEDGDIKLDETPMSDIILDLIINKKSNGVWGYWANESVGSHLWIPEINEDVASVRRALAEVLSKWRDEVSSYNVEKMENGWLITVFLIDGNDFSLDAV